MQHLETLLHVPLGPSKRTLFLPVATMLTSSCHFQLLLSLIAANPRARATLIAGSLEMAALFAQRTEAEERHSADLRSQAEVHEKERDEARRGYFGRIIALSKRYINLENVYTARIEALIKTHRKELRTAAKAQDDQREGILAVLHHTQSMHAKELRKQSREHAKTLELAAEKHAAAPQLTEVRQAHEAEIATLTARHATQIAEMQARLEAVTVERDAWTNRMGLARTEVATNPDPAHQRRLAMMDEGLAMLQREIRDMEEMEAQLDRLFEAKKNGQSSTPVASTKAIPDRQSQRAELQEVLARSEAVRQEVLKRRLARVQRSEVIKRTLLRPREPQQGSRLSDVATSAAKVCYTIIELQYFLV
jgi:hypothetical protein